MDSRHGAQVRKKLMARRHEVLDALANGVPDWDLYNRMVGQLQGLAEAMLLSEEADRELSGD